MERIASEGGDMTLKTYVATKWPTPKVNDMDQDPEKARERMQKREEQGLTTGGIRNLTSDAKNWPTPRASDNEGGIPSNVELSDGSFSRTNADGVRWGVKLKDATANWPTMTAGNPSNANSKRGSDSIYGAVENWPTPSTMDDISRNRMRPSRAATNRKTGYLSEAILNEEAKKWPTPNASEHKYRMQGNTQQSNGLTATARKSDIHSTLQAPETETDGHTCSPSCRRLNPLFAEHLMGLPLGWTCVSGPLETESFQRWQLALSAYLARN